MPITLSQPGDEVTIIRIKGNDSHRKFLANLGFVVGEKVKVITSLKGNLIVCIKGCRVALSKPMANKIIVS